MNSNESNNFWAGIDVSKSSLQVSAAPFGTRLDQWNELPSLSYPFTSKGVGEMTEWIREQPGQCVGICVESTGAYSERLVLAMEGGPLPRPSIVNPARPLNLARSIGLRDKTDEQDAAVLALYGLVHRPRTMTRMTPQHKELRDLWRAREDLVDNRTTVANQIEQSNSTVICCLHRKRMSQIQKLILDVVKKMDALITRHDDLKHDYGLLLTIPGIGPLTARLLLAELGDLRTWRRNELIGYSGLFPRRYESGTSIYRRPRMARGGGSRIRKGLFMAALSQRHRSTALSQFSERLVKRGKAKKSAIGALMRKLLLVARAVVTTGKPYDPTKVGTGNLGLT